MEHKDLKIGTLYKITYDSGESTLCRLKEVLTYSFLVNDYLFEVISGDRALADASPLKEVKPNCFPLPGLLIERINIEEVTTENTTSP